MFVGRLPRVPASLRLALIWRKSAAVLRDGVRTRQPDAATLWRSPVANLRSSLRSPPQPDGHRAHQQWHCDLHRIRGLRRDHEDGRACQHHRARQPLRAARHGPVFTPAPDGVAEAWMTQQPPLQCGPAMPGRPGCGKQEGHGRHERKKDTEHAESHKDQCQRAPQESRDPTRCRGRPHTAWSQRWSCCPGSRRKCLTGSCLRYSRCSTNGMLTKLSSMQRTVGDRWVGAPKLAWARALNGSRT